MPKDSVIGAISSERARKHVEVICKTIPHRAAGAENGKRMAEYSRDALLADGIADATIFELPAVVSFPEPAGFKVTATGEEIPANTLGHSTETGPEGITGELVYVGSGAFEDYEGLDVTGKIILTELSYAPGRHEKQRIAALKGAIGAVMMNWGGPENPAVPMGSVKPNWGSPTPEGMRDEMPTIPCIGIARVDGLRLKAEGEKAPVEIWMRPVVENGWRPVQITVGEVAAPETSPESEDFVLIGGHQDSWPGEAATDNAAGNACMLELARVMNENRDQLRRGVVCGFWTAHETGTMAGSAWYADHEWARLRDHAVAYLQIDQPACVGTDTLWAAGSNAELKTFHESVAAEHLEGRGQLWHRAAKHGDSSFFGLGIPAFAGNGSFTEDELKATALATLGWWHHSTENTLDKLDWEWMQTHLEIYAAWVWELCTAPVLPFTFTPVAGQVSERLEELSAPGQLIGLEAAEAAAARFAEAAATFDARAKAAAEAFDGSDAAEAMATRINTCMKRLSRILVPLQSTSVGKYGHDTYGYTPQGSMIPILYDLPELATLEEGEDFWMLRTKLVRARNKVIDGLDEATTLIADTLEMIGD
ncbi:M28 family peptidase [Pseudooceanicola nanhaiensis]|uniref:M28 family peptidase n=1 Tax=Pseudooceanicola nanhaiensis TaxID=375761 RepID=UPI001CD713ED|nr:M28 family peptidase [Pseudooceanicola nanhaiensis]MCA0921887.1 M28 family metallopeptidase [Pseudooceanicola nanhaiensis]